MKKHNINYSLLFLVFFFMGILLWKNESKEDVKAVNVAYSTVAIDKSSEDNLPSEENTYSPEIEIETLDWWKEARYVFKTNSIAEVTDISTQKSFKVKRTMGSNHADAEALTLEDTKIIKDIWGGFSWERRAVIVEINGRKLAASMSAMPHAGIDSAPAFKVISNRSLDYGRGENLDVIKNNGMDGHFDIHFLNSTRHKDGKKDPQHQTSIKTIKE